MFNITHAIATQDKSEIPTAYNISIKVFNLLTLPRFHSETHIRITPMRYQTIKNVTILYSSIASSIAFINLSFPLAIFGESRIQSSG